jgi:hypothetical protein
MTFLVSRAMCFLVIAITTALLLVGVVGAWSASLYILSADAVGPAYALVIASGVPLLIAVALLFMILRAFRLKSMPRLAAENEQALGDLGNVAGSQLLGLIVAHPRKAAMASLLAGFATGFSRDVRSALLKSLER